MGSEISILNIGMPNNQSIQHFEELTYPNYFSWDINEAKADFAENKM